MPSRKWFFLCAMGLFLMGHAFAKWEEEPKVSTEPIGSPFYRHLADQMRQDLRQLVKFEKKGFGRTEMVALIIISSTIGKPIRNYGNRRLKDSVTLKELAAEAHLDHDKLIEESRRVKEQIEAMGDKNLPPPLYEMGEISEAKPAPESKAERKKKKKESKEEPKKEPAARPSTGKSELD